MRRHQRLLTKVLNTTPDNKNEHFSGQQNRRLLIWSFLCFEWWLRTFMA